MDSLERRSSRLSLAFSCVGHGYSHLFGPIFYVVALSLEGEFALSHGEVISLVVVGNLLFGLAAPLAGWLGDRWSATGMMALFFLGGGAALVATGLAGTPFQIALALSFAGLFASIYHPVGIAWLVRHAEKRGTALGINGVFGALGPGIAALLGGLLAAEFGWRAAFVVPGLLMVATGGAFTALVARGVIVETAHDRVATVPPARADQVRAFAVLAVTMLCTGFIYQASQAALPKLFAERFDGGMASLAGVGTLVATVYFVAAATQVAAGWMADRWSMKTVYIAAFVLQIPALVAAGSLGGPALLALAAFMVSANVGALPAENGLVALFAPSRWRSLAFGMKFVLAFGISGLGAKLEGWMYDLTGGFFHLFAILGAIAAVGAAAGLLLPSQSPPAPAPAGGNARAPAE